MPSSGARVLVLNHQNGLSVGRRQKTAAFDAFFGVVPTPGTGKRVPRHIHVCFWELLECLGPVEPASRHSGPHFIHSETLRVLLLKSRPYDFIRSKPLEFWFGAFHTTRRITPVRFWFTPLPKSSFEGLSLQNKF